MQEMHLAYMLSSYLLICAVYLAPNVAKIAFWNLKVLLSHTPVPSWGEAAEQMPA
jgi:Skp family chaperone for outer membrane proteins